MELFDQATAKPSRALELDSQGNMVVIFPYAVDYLVRVRQIPGRWWNPERSGDKYWHVPITTEALKKALELFPEFKVSTLLAERASIVGQDSPKPQTLPDGPQPEWINIKLFPFQRAGVATLLKTTKALLADDMGLGKTYQGIAWASYTVQGKNNASEGPQTAPQGVLCRVCGKPLLTPKVPHTRIKFCCANKVHRRLGLRLQTEPYGTIVVCPATVKYNWEQAINQARPHDKVMVIDSGISIPRARSVQWVVINYDILDKHLESLYAFHPNTIVLDESHSIKNPKAIRTQMASALCMTTPRRLLMTGTPILNRPVELWPQLLALGQVNESQFFQWAKRYCNARKFRVSWHREVWDFSGASNLDELWQTLQGFTVRRLKKDVLPDLPDILYTELRIPLSAEYAAQYAREKTNFEEWLTALEESGKPPSTTEQLTHLTALRQIAVAGKVSQLVDRLADFVASQTKVVIFCTYLQAGLYLLRSQLPKEWKYITITGEQSAKERQIAKESFQKDPTILFALCSTMAAGVGIDLFAADTVIFLDEPWVPGIREQAIARTHRIGQTSDKVHVIDLIGKDTIDESVLKVLRRKKEVIDQAVDNIAPTEAELAATVANDLLYKRRTVHGAENRGRLR